MTRIVRAITPPAVGAYTLTGVEYIAPGYSIIGISRDNTKFFSGSGNILRMSTDVHTAATTPTWTVVNDFTTQGGQYATVDGMHEMTNGEVLIATVDGNNRSVVYVSTGWAANPATATWAVALQAQNGKVQGPYGMTQWQSGANGVVLLPDSNTAQTLGGSANDATDATRGGLCWLSTDFGKTFAQVFDFRAWAASKGVPYPAGCHLHGASYDEKWDRLWLCFGDNTGDGKVLAGLGYIQVLYSDDRGATWNLLPSPSKWVANTLSSANMMQFISIAPLEHCLVLSPDVTAPGTPSTYARTGYRTMGVFHPGTSLPSNGGVGGFISRAGAGKPIFVGGVDYATQAAAKTAYIPVLAPNQDAWSRIAVPVPVQTPNNTAFGFSRVYGPFPNGKIVATAAHSVGGSTLKLMRATLVAPTV